MWIILWYKYFAYFMKKSFLPLPLELAPKKLKTKKILTDPK